MKVVDYNGFKYYTDEKGHKSFFIVKDEKNRYQNLDEIAKIDGFIGTSNPNTEASVSIKYFIDIKPTNKDNIVVKKTLEMSKPLPYCVTVEDLTILPGGKEDMKIYNMKETDDFAALGLMYQVARIIDPVTTVKEGRRILGTVTDSQYKPSYTELFGSYRPGVIRPVNGVNHTWVKPETIPGLEDRTIKDGVGGAREAPDNGDDAANFLVGHDERSAKITAGLLPNKRFYAIIGGNSYDITDNVQFTYFKKYTESYSDLDNQVVLRCEPKTINLTIPSIIYLPLGPDEKNFGLKGQSPNQVVEPVEFKTYCILQQGCGNCDSECFGCNSSCFSCNSCNEICFACNQPCYSCNDQCQTCQECDRPCFSCNFCQECNDHCNDCQDCNTCQSCDKCQSEQEQVLDVCDKTDRPIPVCTGCDQPCYSCNSGCQDYCQSHCQNNNCGSCQSHCQSGQNPTPTPVPVPDPCLSHCQSCQDKCQSGEEGCTDLRNDGCDFLHGNECLMGFPPQPKSEPQSIPDPTIKDRWRFTGNNRAAWNSETGEFEFNGSFDRGPGTETLYGTAKIPKGENLSNVTNMISTAGDTPVNMAIKEDPVTGKLSVLDAVYGTPDGSRDPVEPLPYFEGNDLHIPQKDGGEFVSEVEKEGNNYTQTLKEYIDSDKKHYPRDPGSQPPTFSNTDEKGFTRRVDVAGNRSALFGEPKKECPQISKEPETYRSDDPKAIITKTENGWVSTDEGGNKTYFNERGEPTGETTQFGKRVDENGNCISCNHCQNCQECYNYCNDCQACNACQGCVGCQCCTSCDGTCYGCFSGCNGCDDCYGGCQTCESCTTCDRCYGCYSNCYSVVGCGSCNGCVSCQNGFKHSGKDCESGQSTTCCNQCNGGEYNSGCSSCNACQGCTTCNGCLSCNKCVGCNHCVGCNSCQKCVGCDKCEGCNECQDCNSCQGCEGCQECNSCQSCFGICNYRQTGLTNCSDGNILPPINPPVCINQQI